MKSLCSTNLSHYPDNFCTISKLLWDLSKDLFTCIQFSYSSWIFPCNFFLRQITKKFEKFRANLNPWIPGDTQMVRKITHWFTKELLNSLNWHVDFKRKKRKFRQISKFHNNYFINWFFEQSKYWKKIIKFIQQINFKNF